MQHAEYVVYGIIKTLSSLLQVYLEEYMHPDQLDGELLLAPGFMTPPNTDYKVMILGALCIKQIAVCTVKCRGLLCSAGCSVL